VWPTAIRAIAEGLVKVESLVTSTVPLAKTGAAIKALKAREDNPVKVQVTP
jgi:threonine dehydrogenase-like Zn-dependent dehydrogenase